MAATRQTELRRRQSLVRWLRSSRIVPPQYRDKGFLRMLLADALPADEQLVLLTRLRDRERDMRAYLEQLVIPLAHPIETGSVRFPDAVRRLGADIHLFVADWLDNFIAELEVSEAPN